MTTGFESIPANWSLTRLDRVASVNARIGWKALTAAEYQPDGYAFLATPNIKGNEIDFENVNYISEYRYEESPDLKLTEGDVLLAKDGNTLGIVNLVRRVPRPATVNGSIAVLRAFDIVPNFLRYAIASNIIQEHINSVKDGMGVPHLFQADIKRLQLPFPPKGEQQRIADYLDIEIYRLGEAFNGFTQLDDLLKQRIFAMIEDNLGKLVDGTGIRIKNLCRPVDQRAMSAADDLPLLSVSIHAGVVPRSDFSDRESRSDSFENYKKCECGDIVVNRMRAFQGAVGVAAMPGMVSPDYLVLRPDELVFPNFLHHLFRSRRFIGEMSSRIRGIGSISQGNVRTPRINWEDLADIRINVPDSTVQKQLVSELDEINSEMMYLRGKISRQLTLLVERRQALITAAITGQFDISSASGRGVQR